MQQTTTLALNCFVALTSRKDHHCKAKPTMPRHLPFKLAVRAVLGAAWLCMLCNSENSNGECDAEAGMDCEDPAVEYYGYNAYIEDDMSANELLLDVEKAREAQPFRQFVGKVKGLSKGAFLVHNSDVFEASGPRNHSVIVLAQHGGRENTKGFMLNEELNEEESAAARKVLHRAGMEEGALSRELLRSSINKHVWLGVGGPVRDGEELWMHFHKCTEYEDVEKVSEGLGYAGDILFILQNSSCAPIKLLYGSFAWPAGKLGKYLTLTL